MARVVARNSFRQPPIGGREKEEGMAKIWRYVPAQRRAYMRWCESGVTGPLLDLRLTMKLTKRRKLSWRCERRHMRQLLRPALCSPAWRSVWGTRSG